ncbi:MAG TPA: hypothetical protein P5234_05005 [Thermoanaerobaculaceae bacterium]|nr:hypothetical protein [Thermoanaerobaculaceae bacterium]HRS15592.1 hypothetical protein [Thermoanaerobaculaceae bacterium]
MRFIARGPACSVLAGAGGMTFVMREAGEAGLPDPAAQDGAAPSPRASRVDGDRWRMVQMRWLGGGQAGGFEALDQRPSRSHYLRGNDSSAWVTDAPQSARTRLLGVWPGVDVELYGNGRHLEFDLVVDPGAETSGLGVELVGVEGVELDAGSGDAVVRFGASELRLRKPIAWEELDGDRRRLAVDYDLTGRQVRFVVAGRNERARLVIDPAVELSTYLGGTGEDAVTGLALDAAGAIYVTGYTVATDFPLANAMQAERRVDSDVFVTKLSPAGDALVYSTYLGGSAPTGGTGSPWTARARRT